MVESRARQQNYLGQGLALGAIMLGLDEVNGPKMVLELDFEDAWRDWPHRHHFPNVKVDISYNEILGILQDSGRKHGPILVCWEGAWPFVPTLRVDDWTANEVADILNKEIPAQVWEGFVAASLKVSRG